MFHCTLPVGSVPPKRGPPPHSWTPLRTLQRRRLTHTHTSRIPCSLQVGPNSVHRGLTALAAALTRLESLELSPVEGPHPGLPAAEEWLWVSERLCGLTCLSLGLHPITSGGCAAAAGIGTPSSSSEVKAGSHDGGLQIARWDNRGYC